MPDTSKCPACNFSAFQPFEICPKCGVIVQKFMQKQAERNQVNQTRQQATVTAAALHLLPGDPEIEVTSKYGAMTIISVAIKVLSALLVLAGILGAFQGGVPLTFRVGTLSGGIIAAVLMWAYSEAIDIGIDIEENQRKLIKILLSKS